MSVEWFGSQSAALFGGVGGAAIGIFCGIVGAAAGSLAPRGKGKRFVLGSFYGMILMGVALLGVGIIAVFKQQPYHVYYPLLLSGGICTIVVSSLLPVVRRQYRNAL